MKDFTRLAGNCADDFWWAIATGMLALFAWPRSSAVAAGLALGSAGLYFSSIPGKSLAGKNAFITGGSRGLGLSLAWNLLERGANVMLVARDGEELKRAKEILCSDYNEKRIFIEICDVTKSTQLTSSINSTIEKMGSIDLLVNNAGSILVGPVTSMRKEEFEAQMKLHLFAVIDAVRLIVPHFRSRGGGNILNICSLGGKVAVPHMIPYDASKFALAGFSQGIAAELAEDGIVVTTAYPSVMRTGSPIQAVFKGNHEKEFAWFDTIDHLPVISMGADTAAKKILDAVEEGKSEAILSWTGTARMMAGAFLPETMMALMRLVARVLPKEDSTERKTGYELAALVRRSPFLKPIAKRAKIVEQVYNQMPRHSAEFNLGVDVN